MKKPTRSTQVALALLRRFAPDVCAAIDERAKVIASMRAMSKKITELKAEREQWRQRCFSAERCVSYELKGAFRAAVERHNKEHGNPLWDI